MTQKLGEPFGTQLSSIIEGVRAVGSVPCCPRAGPGRLHAALQLVECGVGQSDFVPKAADPLQVFTPIVLVGFSPNVLVIHPSVPAKSAKELIAVAKARPDALAFGSNGAGSLSHLTGALFMQRAGIRMLHVPYKGAAPAVIDTMAGNVSVLFATRALRHRRAQEN